MDVSKEMVSSRCSGADTLINSQRLTAHISPAQVQIRQNYSKEKGKWTQTPTINQEAICKWYKSYRQRKNKLLPRECHLGIPTCSRVDPMTWSSSPSQNKLHNCFVCFLFCFGLLCLTVLCVCVWFVLTFVSCFMLLFLEKKNIKLGV